MATLNPIQLGVIWQRLSGLFDEVAQTFVRTSFSSVVRDNWDLAFGLLDTRGRQFMQPRRSIPSFIGTMPRTLRAMLSVYPVAALAPGDVLISNDSWHGTGHLNDITMMHPVFREGRLICFIGSVFHTVDIGGAPSVNARDCYEEGICIPIAKILDGGRENRVVVDLIAENVREPGETLGDIRAQFAAYGVATRKLFQLMDEEGLATLDDVAEEIVSRTERSMRGVIAALPDGEYGDEVMVDGFDEPLVVRCRLCVRGSNIVVDYAGTSAQIDRPINSVLNYTYAYSAYALKCALDPKSPTNDGVFQPIGVTAPEGTLLNARRPAPVWGRHLAGHYVPFAIYGALAKVAPERVIADCGSPLWNVYFKGRDARTGRPFVKMFFMNGGHGARPHMDGPGCLSFPSNVSNQPIERFENQVPLIVTEKALVPDSAGAGRFRGGPAQRISFRVVGDSPVTVTFRHERVKFPPRGLLGGEPGSPGVETVNGRRVPAKTSEVLNPGDVVTFQMPGGGGMHPPKERDRALIAADLRAGLITPEFAWARYGYGPDPTDAAPERTDSTAGLR
ncbi:MAG: hydantoinase B/oxoprolinase family protein [Proteobacteria bacterium]|nr:hydantoinase B/oxoprolinase family protein [Pseudomonadota bacterium]